MTDRKWDHEPIDHEEVGPPIREEYPMTDQSRVEAVANALLLCSKMQIDLGKADLMQMAQAAIEANDAWIAAQIAAHDPIAFRRTKSPRIEGLDAITRRILDR